MVRFWSISHRFSLVGWIFFGTTYTDIYVNSNGTISFGSAFTNFQTANLDNETTPLLAVFFADVNINNGGEIYWDLDPANGAVTITWSNVAPFSGSGSNSFQVQIMDLGGGDYSIEYIYGDIQWTGSGGGDVADIGYTDGAAQDFQLDGSADAAVLIDYETHDFGNGHPAGTDKVTFINGQPAALDMLVEGTAGDDLIDAVYLGDPDGDVIDGGDGTGAAGNEDTVLAGAGDDTVLAGAEDDVVYGEAGDDSLSGGDGDDTLEGGAGSDTIAGDAGDDVIYGDSGFSGNNTADLSLNWLDEGADGDDISSGFTQDTGGVNVAVTYTDDGNGTEFELSDTTQYVGAGEDFGHLKLGVFSRRRHNRRHLDAAAGFFCGVRKRVSG